MELDGEVDFCWGSAGNFGNLRRSALTLNHRYTTKKSTLDLNILLNLV